MPGTRQLLEEAMREVLAVARAQGAGVSEDTVKRSLASLDRAPAAAIGNLRDVIDGRPSELETEVGVIVRLARAVGVEVPRHAVLYASLLPQERRAGGEIDFPVAGAKSPRAA
jgi:2-dehydropantoate 2-reductase